MGLEFDGADVSYLYMIEKQYTFVEMCVNEKKTLKDAWSMNKIGTDKSISLAGMEALNRDVHLRI